PGPSTIPGDAWDSAAKPQELRARRAAVTATVVLLRFHAERVKRRLPCKRQCHACKVDGPPRSSPTRVRLGDESSTAISMRPPLPRDHHPAMQETGFRTGKTGPCPDRPRGTLHPRHVQWAFGSNGGRGPVGDGIARGV